MSAITQKTFRTRKRHLYRGTRPNQEMVHRFVRSFPSQNNTVGAQSS